MKRTLTQRLSGISLCLMTALVGSSQCTTSTPAYNDCSSFGDAINSFSLASVPSVGNSGCGSSGYNFFASPVRTLVQGQTYAWSATVGGGFEPEAIAIWIDLNNNGQYEASELMTSTGLGLSHSGFITIPYSATPASNVAMRVRCAWWEISAMWNGSMACTNYVGDFGGYGETEDYRVNIQCPSLSNPVPSSAQVEACETEQVLLTASAPAGLLTWYANPSGGSSIGTGTGYLTPIIMEDVTYYVATETTGCASVRVAIEIQVQEPLEITAMADPPVVCGDEMLILSGSGATSYQWDHGVLDGVSFTPNGSQTYNVIGTAAGECPGYASITVNAYDLPVIAATASETEICEGEPIALYGEGGVSYEWSENVEDGVPFSPDESATYVVTGTDINGCENTASIDITVLPSPNISSNLPAEAFCTTDEDFVLIGNPSGGYWYGTSVNGDIFSPSEAGADTYFLAYIFETKDGCLLETTFTVEVEDCLNVENQSASADHFEVYPNPSAGYFRIALKTSGPLNIDILDVSGRRIYQQKIAGSYPGDVIPVLLTEPSGVYIMKLTDSTGVHTRRITIH